ncbi:hypothetical protein LTR70_004862 [Exophiala xenobiotica]|uniref:RING-type domain-containing protein n=1 Tax=Lithohypha guttulata TaxID=1690604 RepID=A0ABR0KC92_9EURO|nr:hypothetical protein LTR24_004480 [Lithohypha guttulata]KAK5319817.1 hypothetical protein LTR70_004862 [Exophiala xenobiotica]
MFQPATIDCDYTIPEAARLIVYSVIWCALSCFAALHHQSQESEVFERSQVVDATWALFAVSVACRTQTISNEADRRLHLALKILDQHPLVDKALKHVGEVCEQYYSMGDVKSWEAEYAVIHTGVCALGHIDHQSPLPDIKSTLRALLRPFRDKSSNYRKQRDGLQAELHRERIQSGTLKRQAEAEERAERAKRTKVGRELERVTQDNERLRIDAGIVQQSLASTRLEVHMLQHHLSCPICYEKEANVALSCGHLFCEGCIASCESACEERIRTRWGSDDEDDEIIIVVGMRCPVCRKPQDPRVEKMKVYRAG